MDGRWDRLEHGGGPDAREYVWLNVVTHYGHGWGPRVGELDRDMDQVDVCRRGCGRWSWNMHACLDRQLIRKLCKITDAEASSLPGIER